MITYYLAKQLKDKEFPNSQEWYNQDETMVYDGISRPTLSELIEACGLDFLSLATLHREYKDVISISEWCAMDFKGKMTNGSTPEEAVAKLWLELHK